MKAKYKKLTELDNKEGLALCHQPPLGRRLPEGVWNEAVRLVWPLGPAGFPEGSREKSSSSHIGKIVQACESNSCLPAPRSTAARRPEWRPRRASMVSGGAAPGERAPALHARDPSEA